LSALVHRHGTAVGDVLDIATGHPELLEPLVPGLPYLKVEVVWAVREEMALTVEDVLSRRTRSVLRRAKGAEGAAGEVARLMARETGQDASLLESEAADFKKSVTTSLERAGLPMADSR
jgi:glycerol-3-phosphate dehydrogenase